MSQTNGLLLSTVTLTSRAPSLIPYPIKMEPLLPLSPFIESPHSCVPGPCISINFPPTLTPSSCLLCLRTQQHSGCDRTDSEADGHDMDRAVRASLSTQNSSSVNYNRQSVHMHTLFLYYSEYSLKSRSCEHMHIVFNAIFRNSKSDSWRFIVTCIHL